MFSYYRASVISISEKSGSIEYFCKNCFKCSKFAKDRHQGICMEPICKNKKKIIL